MFQRFRSGARPEQLARQVDIAGMTVMIVRQESVLGHVRDGERLHQQKDGEAGEADDAAHGTKYCYIIT
jgi:hypothetical protein